MQPKMGSNVPLGIIAGRGDLPTLLVKAAQQDHRPVYVIAVEGQTDPSVLELAPHVQLTFGQVGKLLAYCKENQIHELVMAGHMSRPSFSSLKPDWEGMKWLSKIAAKSFGDDNLLRAVIEMLESYGLKVVGADDVLASLLTPEGQLTQGRPDEQAWKDIFRGRDVLRQMAQADVGQAISVRAGVVMAVEAIEGTDAMIVRTGDLAKNHPLETRPVLVKLIKTHQERRADLPTIGPKTIDMLVAAGFAGVAIESGRSLILDQEAVVDQANAQGLFVVGI